MKQIAIGCLVLIGLAVLFVVGMLWYGSKELKPLVVEVMQQYNDGKDQEIYEATSSEFKEETTLADLQAYFAARRALLGSFQEAGTVTGTHRSTDGDLSVGEVTLTLRFEKGEVPATFKFVKKDDTWKLLNIQLEIPEELRPEPLPETPETVEAEARAFLDLYNQDKKAVLYDAFPPELKEAHSAEDFTAAIDRTRMACGKVVEATLVSREKDDEGYQRLRFDVIFEKTPGYATFKYCWRNDEWVLFGYEMAPKP